MKIQKIKNYYKSMSKTKPDKLLVLFEDLAEKMNINIVQGKGDFQGGMCSVNDESYIVLNKLKPVDQRLAVLVREFSRLNLKNIFVQPILREYISNTQQELL
ncbi:MAG: hypothetical protein ACJZ15_06480 [Candidatus Neomarinimicrobiota bacterium]|nr:MAG: hypothetical protein CBC68_00860 [Candidatus Marinimicrobia bacterium TMED108]RCL90068.1 MAG: hypothetical protein DBW60_02405 [bacterium]